MAVVETLVIPAGKVASSLTDFVTRVDLAHLGAAWWADTTSDLGNVRVKSAGSVIPFDIVAYDRTAKTGELFFKASLTTSANTFTIETVNGATALAVTDTNGRNNVWVDYLAVFITSGVGMADRLKDRAGKSGDLSVVTGTLGTPTNPGWLKGSGDVNVRSVGVGLNTTFHFGASYVMSSASGNNSFLSYSTDSTTDSHRELLCLESGVNPAMYNSTNSFYEHLGSEPATPNAVAGVRERFVGVKNGTTNRYAYRNGVKGTTQAGVSARPTSPGNALWILCGNGATTSRFFGEVNYVYLRTGVSSDAWQDAEYVSWETPSSFYSIDATVAAPAATATAAALAPTVSGASDATVSPPAATATAAGVAPSLVADSTVAGAVATAAAEAVAPAVLGDGAVVVQAPAATATADALAPVVIATAAVVSPAATATADALAPSVSAASNITALAATATAEAVAPSVFNDSPHATVIAPAATASATAPAPVVTATFPVDTDVSNFEDGLELLATASVDVFVPGAFVATQKVDKAIALPVPTMVNGRPT